VYKVLNSAATLIQRTTTEAPQGHMYYVGLDVHKKSISYCVKDVSGKVHEEGQLGATRWELDGWMKTLPQPWVVARGRPRDSRHLSLTMRVPPDFGVLVISFVEPIAHEQPIGQRRQYAGGQYSQGKTRPTHIHTIYPPLAVPVHRHFRVSRNSISKINSRWCGAMLQHTFGMGLYDLPAGLP